MKNTVQKLFILLLTLGAIQMQGVSQVLAGFENFGLHPGEHLNNAAPEKGFLSGSISLPNFYDVDFNFWSGWAISADTNRTTPGFLNQYSSIAGRGAQGTTAYAVGYIFDPIIIRLQPHAIGKPMIGMYVNNSTYTYLSVRDGDSFAKKFGGETGNDPDFLMLTIKKYSGGAIDDDSINFYLADYRFPQSQKDYIISAWSYIDLTNLGEVDSLLIRMTSSDVGVFGMNTPAYVCIDQVSTDNLLSASSIDARGKEIVIGPNPARDVLNLDIPIHGTFAISSMQGVVVWTRTLDRGQHSIAVSDWPSGIYFLSHEGKIAAKICIE
jgi:hypothetical protein